MRYTISLLFIILNSYFIWADNIFNPNNPEEPGLRYSLTVNVYPEGAGSVSPQGVNQYNVEQRVNLSAYANSDYTFKGWKQNGIFISENPYFSYLIPSAHTEITAIFDFIPGNPNEPEVLPIRRRLHLNSSPIEGGSFNITGGTIFGEGTTTTVWVYPNTGYVFDGWQIDNKTVSTNSSYEVTFGKTDVTLTGVFRFEPISPSNPNANFWNASTGELIIDDFTSGSLSSAISDKIGEYSNRNKVLKITVAGVMSSYDFGTLNNLTECVEIDLSRVTGITVIPGYAFYYGKLNKITIPAEIEEIEDYAFYECTNLSEIISYAFEPPKLGNSVFTNINENAVLRVLQAAIPGYMDREQWKDLLIMPLLEEAGALTVAFPETISEGMYANLFLELVHAGTAQKQKLVTTEKKSYTFRGLLFGDKYNIYLKNRNEEVLAEITNVEITNNDTKTAFSSLPYLYTVKVKVTNKEGTDLTSQTSIRWYTVDDKLLAQSDTVGGVMQNKKLKYQIGLNETLGRQYKFPSLQTYTVSQTGNFLTYALQPIDTLKIQGIVTGEDKQAISDAVVSISQLLNGKYTKTAITKTDRSGKYSLTIYNALSNFTISATDYVNKSFALTDFSQGTVMDTVRLAAISGAVITTNFTYTSSVAQGEASNRLNGYSNYQNVAYTLYNVTKGTGISNFSVQYPSIVLLEPTDSGDKIRITATSRSGEFEPAESILTIDNENKATAQIDIVELGGIKAVYNQSENTTNVAVLYNSSGQQIRRLSYSNQSGTFKGLSDGVYTLVSMVDSKRYNSILKLSELITAGLIENTDFVKSAVTVQSGIIKEVSISVIPAMDDTKLLYTGNNTFFRANKSSVVAGNYMTLSGKIDFQSTYENRISDVKMIVDLPEGCSFVENSIMEGSKVKAGYIYDAGRIIIPLENYTDLVRFCVIPTQGGSCKPNGFVEFNLEGEHIIQPIGEANFITENLSLIVPKLVARKTIPVNGTAQAGAVVEVYDKGVVIGNTISLSNGTWTTTCDLYEPYNLSMHSIYAKVKTKDGVEVQSETKNLTYDVNAVQASTVTMSFYNEWTKKNIEVIFDILNSKTSNTSYEFYKKTDVTFIIDFTNNNPEIISDVTLYVYTDQGEVIPLTVVYNEKADKWIAVKEFDSHNLPVNVSLDFEANYVKFCDIKELEDGKEDIKAVAKLYLENTTIIKAFFQDISNATDASLIELGRELDTDATYRTLAIDEDMEAKLEAMTLDEFDAYLDKELALLQLEVNNDIETIKSFDKFFELPETYDKTFISGVNFKVEDCKGITVEKLYEEGYKEVLFSDMSFNYILITENEVICVDLKNNVKIAVSIPETLQFRSGIGDISDFVQAKAAAIRKINDIIGVINAMYNDLVDMAKVAPELIEDQINKTVKQLNKVDRYILMCNKKGSSRLAVWKTERFRLQMNLFMARYAHKIAKTCIRHLLKCLPVINYIAIANQLISNINQLGTLYFSILDPCPNDESMASACRAGCFSLLTAVVSIGTIDLISSFTSDAEIVGGVLGSFATSGTSLTIAAWGVVQKAVTAIGRFTLDLGVDYAMESLRKDINSLDCIVTPNTPEIPMPSTPSITPIHDPSGYVYEAVPANRLQGVTATVYHKTWEENMYGDREEKIVLWDASEYSQENPLYTDENGMYGWDVPAGSWQVKYEKDGYQTTYSEWLPVPPPQLDVNIGMIQSSQPYIQVVHGYETGIIIEFDKFMQPTTLTTDQIVVTRNGVIESGSILLLNKDANLYGNNEEFASKARFVPEKPLATTDNVILAVSRKVKSYAGISMENDFTQQIEITKEAKSINVEPSIELEYNGSKELQISVEPLEASLGKKIIARSASSSIATVTNEVLLDENGKAKIIVNAELSGTTVITISVDGMDLNTDVIVKVALPRYVNQLSLPTASIPSGTIIAKNSTVELSSDIEGVKIFYTIDETSPSESVGIEYTQPITITVDVTIKAIATKEGMLNSEIATFKYSVENGSGIYQTEKGDIIVYVRNQTVYIKGLKDKEQYEVYSLIGNVIAQGIANDNFEQTIRLPHKGVFILSIPRNKIKILVE
jgi:hypothetical protein